MKNERNIPLDDRVHAYLDGELTPSESAAFEGELQGNDELRKQVLALRRVDAWLGSTRPQAPPSLVPAVEHAVEAELAPAAGTVSWSPLRLVRASRWVAPAGLAAAAALFILLRPGLLREQVPDSTPVVTAPSSADSAPGAALQASELAGNTVHYEFRLHASEAREVCLAGDFNQWTVCKTRLVRVGEDLWSVSMELPRGRHEYMFVVDGRWVTDPGAAMYADDGFGNRNAVLAL